MQINTQGHIQNNKINHCRQNQITVEIRLITPLLNGLVLKRDLTRECSFRVIKVISLQKPSVLSSHCLFLVNMLNSANSHHKNNVVHLIANLIALKMIEWLKIYAGQNI